MEMEEREKGREKCNKVRIVRALIVRKKRERQKDRKKYRDKNKNGQQEKWERRARKIQREEK